MSSWRNRQTPEHPKKQISERMKKMLEITYVLNFGQTRLSIKKKKISYSKELAMVLELEVFLVAASTTKTLKTKKQ